MNSKLDANQRILPPVRTTSIIWRMPKASSGAVGVREELFLDLNPFSGSGKDNRRSSATAEKQGVICA